MNFFKKLFGSSKAPETQDDQSAPQSPDLFRRPVLAFDPAGLPCGSPWHEQLASGECGVRAQGTFLDAVVLHVQGFRHDDRAL